MDYVSENRIEVDLTQNAATANNNFLSVLHKVSFFENTYIDLSSYTFMPFTRLEFYSTHFDLYTVYTNLQDNPLYGLYGFAIAQSLLVYD